jgi:hypothetical protein
MTLSHLIFQWAREHGHELWIFENEAPRNIFRSQREEIMRGLKKTA